jgi:Ca2+/Na+ antiporter
MKLDVAATLVAISALIGYFLMRFLLPAYNLERLVFLGSLALIAVFLMLLHRRQRRKKEMAEQAEARGQTNEKA